MLHRQLLRDAIVCLAAFGLALLAAPSLEAHSQYKVLHSFMGKPDGGGVFAGVVIDGKGNLYGTTWGGGTYGYGTVFELTSGSKGKWSEIILHNFCKDLPSCDDGAASFSGVILDGAGNLYGASNAATFEMTRKAGGWNFLVLCDCMVPSVIDAAGNLYGDGGPGHQNAGAIDELVRFPAADGWTEKVLHNFCSWEYCRDGVLPEFGLTWDAAGNLYGVTTQGGVHKAGVAFELEHTVGGWKEHVLHNFPGPPGDGYPPSSGLVFDGSGNLYGTTLQGGGAGCYGGSGTVFKLAPGENGRWKETILYNFPTLKDGAGPVGTFAMDLAGNLYGVAGGGIGSCGGGGCGVVYKMTPDSDGKWTYTVLHRFTGSDGALPVAGPTFDGQGNLYGTASAGGAGGYGVVYKITP